MEIDTVFQSLIGKVIALSDTSQILKSQIEKHGAKTVEFINRNVDFLIINENNTKLKELADILGIPVLSESYFITNLNSLPKINLSKRKKLNTVTPIKKRRRGSFPITPCSGKSKIVKEIQVCAIASTQEAIERSTVNSVIALEGNIGVGKSTLCTKFKTTYHTKCSVYKEQGNQKFLQLFYSDPKTYGFAFQWGMLKTRQYQLSLAKHDTKYGRHPPRQFYFWDRSMIGDYIFALWNHLLGSISEKEMEVYEDEFGGGIKSLESIPFFSTVNCYVLLSDEPVNCKYRVEKIRKNESEADIPLFYYEGIDDIHYSLFVDHLIPKKLVKVLVLSWGQYNDPKILWDNLMSIVSNKKEVPTIKKLYYEPETLDNSCFVYKTPEQVLDFYQKIKCICGEQEQLETEVVQQRKLFSTIYIPSNILTIPAEEKGIKYCNYNITFYRNEFKRVVLWHLSHSQNISFYVN